MHVCPEVGMPFPPHAPTFFSLFGWSNSGSVIRCLLLDWSTGSKMICLKRRSPFKSDPEESEFAGEGDMEESWRISMGSVVQTRRSTDESARKRWASAGDGLDPDDFRDVFGGPPRSVILRRFAGEFPCEGWIPAATIYDEIFRSAGTGVAVEGGGRRLPEFRIPTASPGRGGVAGRIDEGFYDDIFGSDGGDRRSSSQSKSMSSSVLSSEELSPLRNSVDDDGTFWSAASKLRPISIPSQRHTSPPSTFFTTKLPDGRYRAANHHYPPPTSSFIDLSDRPGPTAVLLRQPSSGNGRSRCFSPPEVFSLEPTFHLGHRLPIVTDNGSPSSAASSVLLESMTTKVGGGCGVRACFHPSVSEKEAEKMVIDVEEGEAVESSFLLDIDCLKTEESTVEGAAALDEAIAWAKEKFMSQVPSGPREMPDDRPVTLPLASVFRRSRLFALAVATAVPILSPKGGKLRYWPHPLPVSRLTDEIGKPSIASPSWVLPSLSSHDTGQPPHSQSPSLFSNWSTFSAGNGSMDDSLSKKVPVLPWMRHPVDIERFGECPIEAVPLLDPRLEEALQKMGIESLFPVQVAMWWQTIGPGTFQRDLCVNSPTGSGKTLAYALPIVQMLSNQTIKSLRALVVLPTRDLALQVKEVFDAIAPAVGLHVGVAVGQSSIADEASKLIVHPKVETFSFSDPEFLPPKPQSAVDILVATPGRLMDHIGMTKGFSLENLCYLVVDETDRLLREAYQSWLPTVIELASPTEAAIVPSELSSLTAFTRVVQERGFFRQSCAKLVKIILSATLPQDPSKLSQLKLYHPLLLASGDRRYKLPEKLELYKSMCESKLKPLYLVTLLQDLKGEKSLVFTSSVESTRRLSKLLNFFGELPFKVREYSGLQHQSLRSKKLKAFREGKIDVLIASDAMTRGMDVVGVRNVINYDVPSYVKAFIHRAGRTARAGKNGRCFTLLRHHEVKRFNKILRKAGDVACNVHPIPSSSLESLRPAYSSALEKLKECIEKKGRRYASGAASKKRNRGH
ncbi:hypothetical protein HPP92_028188 [Vanilla planifolia]|uniref:ATP-dependent RNA helicase n=1 Tax=Vanilla planifolia TaxID=51239 RepID=A0A835P887_VANPL|nr:hypothetical protein HPP92_028188 [Vanilla planifolia]